MFNNSFTKKKYGSIRPDENRIKPLPPIVADKLPDQRNCPACASFVSELELIQNYKVCPHCGYHYTITAWDRIHIMADENSFEQFDAGLSSYNRLNFPDYDDKLTRAKQQSGCNEAIITGYASIGGYKTVLGVMESRFMMASMGAVVGEKIYRAVDRAIDSGYPLIICSCSGGARMQEGMIALMQMAKTSAAINRFHKNRQFYISVMTNPTTGGVSASFASLADIIIAEPGALIGFTGPRVIRQTIGERLPENFQSSEFLLEHGMIDIVKPRMELRTTISSLLKLHHGGLK
jgi:acetyl-CoA carboxylase carboxyl transferase subunit beta